MKGGDERYEISNLGTGGSAAADRREQILEQRQPGSAGPIGGDDPGSSREVIDERTDSTLSGPGADNSGELGPVATPELSDKSLVTLPDKSLVTCGEKTESQVTSDLSQATPAESTLAKTNVRSLDEYKSRRKSTPKAGRKRRVSADPDRPPTPPSHQWRRAENAWVLWRVTYDYSTGKQQKKFKFVNNSYISIAAVRAAKRRANDQRRENRAGSIFD